MAVNEETLMWVEKYRPKTLNDVVGLKDIVESIKAFMKNPKTMPHLMLAGIPGTGKTTIALAIAHTLYGQNWRNFTLELNASDERGIDTVLSERESKTSLGIADQALEISHFHWSFLMNATK